MTVHDVIAFATRGWIESRLTRRTIKPRLRSTPTVETATKRAIGTKTRVSLLRNVQTLLKT
jgi:hypothetical protein